MRFNKSLAVAGALGLAVLTAGPALAEPIPSDLTAETATPDLKAPETAETQAPETAEPESTKTPDSKPSRETQETAKPKPSESKPPVKEEVKQEGSITLSDTTAKPGQVIRVHVTSTKEDITQVVSNATNPNRVDNIPSGRKSYSFDIRVADVTGSHPVDAYFADGSHARAILTVAKDEAEVIKPSFGFDTQKVPAGGEFNVQVGGDLRAKTVTITSKLIPGGSKTVTLEDAGKGRGTARLHVAVPGTTKADKYAISADFGNYGGTINSSVDVTGPEINEPRLGMSSYELKPGQTVTVDAVGNLDAGEVIVSSDAFPQVFTKQLKDMGNGLGRATFDVTIPADAKVGTYDVRADFGRFGKAQGTFKVVADVPVKYGITVSPRAVDADGYVRWTLTGKASDAEITSPAFDAITKVNLGATQSDIVHIKPKVAPGTYPVYAVFTDANSKRVGSAETTVTIKGEVAAPVVNLRLEPGTVAPGQSYFAGVTTKNIKPGTWVTFKDPGGKKFYAKLDGYGSARVKLTAPKDTKPGRYTVSATVANKTVYAKVTIAAKAKINLHLDPNRVNAGGNFIAYVATKNVKPGTWVRITDPEGKKFYVKLNRAGVGGKKFHVPAGTKPGKYWFTAEVNGAKDAEKLVVRPRYSAQGAAYTPLGGAATGGGIAPAAEGTSSLGGVALGGLLIAGGAGSALFGRRKVNEG
ncbi:hypothetical protein ACIBG8_22420 [Nonomuraea sp. NPDC050556]|uniref:hypothetical protein n=1 Tax=Nonomuraea sp. NPDC050556 TaxID=3364369 RepID=UPI00379387E9